VNTCNGSPLVSLFASFALLDFFSVLGFLLTVGCKRSPRLHSEVSLSGVVLLAICAVGTVDKCCVVT